MRYAVVTGGYSCRFWRRDASSASIRPMEVTQRHMLKCAITDYTIALTTGQRTMGLQLADVSSWG